MSPNGVWHAEPTGAARPGGAAEAISVNRELAATKA